MPTIKTKTTNSLLTALQFIAPVMERKGTLSETHCSLSQNQASAFNGLIAMGHPITEDITAYPCHAPLLAALSQSRSGASISIKDNGDLFISAAPFRATIKGVRVNQIQTTSPDPMIAALPATFFAALPTLVKIIKDEDSNAAKCSLLLQSGSMIATDGVMLIEAWHGASMPSLMLPKEAAVTLAKIKEPLVGFGFTANRSVTFWYENKAWFKTQLQDVKFPDLSFITNLAVSPAVVPTGFADAIKACRAHTEDEDSAVYLADNALQSHALAEEGAVYEVQGLPGGQIFNGKYLAMVADIASGIDFSVRLREDRILGFVGNGVRGWLMPRAK